MAASVGIFGFLTEYSDDSSSNPGSGMLLVTTKIQLEQISFKLEKAFIKERCIFRHCAEKVPHIPIYS